MTICNWQLDGDKERCQNCAATRPAGRRPIRNCPAMPDTIESRLAGRIANLAHAAREQYSNMLYMRDPDELTRLIGVCLDCDDFDNRCDHSRFPLGCSGRRQWLKALASVGFRDCPRWQDGQAG